MPRCRFVQCYSCGNPETVIKIRKRSEMIELKCKACGFVRCAPLAGGRGGGGGGGGGGSGAGVRRPAFLCGIAVQARRARAGGGRQRPNPPKVLTAAHRTPIAWNCSEVSPKEKLVGYIIKNPPEEKMSKAEKKWVLVNVLKLLFNYCCVCRSKSQEHASAPQLLWFWLRLLQAVAVGQAAAALRRAGACSAGCLQAPATLQRGGSACAASWPELPDHARVPSSPLAG